MHLIHSVPAPAVHALYDVGVGVQRDAHAGVAQKLLDVLGVLACHEENRSTAMTEVVEPDAEKPGATVRLPFVPLPQGYDAVGILRIAQAATGGAA